MAARRSPKWRCPIPSLSAGSPTPSRRRRWRPSGCPGSARRGIPAGDPGGTLAPDGPVGIALRHRAASGPDQGIPDARAGAGPHPAMSELPRVETATFMKDYLAVGGAIGIVGDWLGLAGSALRRRAAVNRRRIEGPAVEPRHSRWAGSSAISGTGSRTRRRRRATPSRTPWAPWWTPSSRSVNPRRRHRQRRQLDGRPVHRSRGRPRPGRQEGRRHPDRRGGEGHRDPEEVRRGRGGGGPVNRRGAGMGGRRR